MAKLQFSASTAERLLAERLPGVPGVVGVMVTDLQTGLSASINPDQPFLAASVAKLPIAMTILYLVSTGHIGLSDQVRYQSSTDYTTGTGGMQAYVREGDAFTVRFLLEQMIVVSDNIARRMLERYIGSGTIRSYMLALGVQPPYHVPWPVMTARGANTLLVRLDTLRSGISFDLTRYLISLLASTIFHDRIPAKLPPGVVVAHKIGTLPTVVHDVGLVYAPERSFILSVFTQDIPYAAATDLIADLAALIYAYEDSLVRAATGYWIYFLGSPLLIAQL